MTTSELKSYIDRILGNNIRLLLPSFWWKRAFGAVIEKVDEKADKSELKTINGESVLGEGDLKIGVKSVESVEELNALEAEVGDIATVASKGELVKVNIVDCYLSSDFEEDWDKYTVIRAIEEKPENKTSFSALYLLASPESIVKDSIIAVIGENRKAYGRYVDGKETELTLHEANKILASGNYRVTIGADASDIDSYFSFFTNGVDTITDAYIKGETWTRLLKEGDVDSAIASAIASAITTTLNTPV